MVLNFWGIKFSSFKLKVRKKNFLNSLYCSFRETWMDVCPWRLPHGTETVNVQWKGLENYSFIYARGLPDWWSPAWDEILACYCKKEIHMLHLHAVNVAITVHHHFLNLLIHCTNSAKSSSGVNMWHLEVHFNWTKYIIKNFQF